MSEEVISPEESAVVPAPTPINRTVALLFLAGAIVFEVFGTMSLKASDGFSQPLWAVAAILSYALAFVCLAQTLSRGLPVGVAYGIWAAIGVALTAVLGFVLFNEPLTALSIVGIGAIIVGVLLLEFGNRDRTD